MGCPGGCAGSGGGTPSLRMQRIARTENFTTDQCGYTVELLQGWYTKLLNLKTQNKVDLIPITYPKINSYLGYVQSALNFNNNICFFSAELAPIVQVINKIDELNL